MENIYEPGNFFSSDHLEAKEYFKQYSEMCSLTLPCTLTTDDKSYFNNIQKEMNLNTYASLEDINALGESCSLDKLRLPDEPENLPDDIPEKLQSKSKLERFYPITNDARELNVINCKEVLDTKTNILDHIGSKRVLKRQIPANKSIFYDILPGSTFIYTILVYRPYSIKYGQRNSGESFRFSHEIQALGTNTLTDLADKIICVSNIALVKEVENTNVDLSPYMNAKEHYPSQSIFIDGIFYNDFRSPHAIDYSQVIIDWAKEKNIGKFKTENMEKTVLDTLTPRLGYPYVYIHQGNCEHIFTFSDAKLIQPNDCLFSRKYPYISSLTRVSNILCFICRSIHSQWVVAKCDKFPHEKVFLCTECCNSYLYVDGKKVTTFELYACYDLELISNHYSETV